MLRNLLSLFLIGVALLSASVARAQQPDSPDQVKALLTGKGYSVVEVANYPDESGSPRTDTVYAMMEASNLDLDSENHAKEGVVIDIRNNSGAIESSDVFGLSNGQTRSKYYGNQWAKDLTIRGVTGSGDLKIVYDVCHNIAKFEDHLVDGSRKHVLVHRKGATRAFPKHHPALAEELQPVGQPVLIPGSMGTHSYILVGTERAMTETFGSCCHGAGRAKSRTQAKRETTADKLLHELRQQGIIVRGETRAGLTEEKPDAYKDVSQVVNVVHGAGLAQKVAKLRPLAVMKG